MPELMPELMPEWLLVEVLPVELDLLPILLDLP